MQASSMLILMTDRDAEVWMPSAVFGTCERGVPSWSSMPTSRTSWPSTLRQMGAPIESGRQLWGR
jgi:hypothetical protein